MQRAPDPWVADEPLDLRKFLRRRRGGLPVVDVDRNHSIVMTRRGAPVRNLNEGIERHVAFMDDCRRVVDGKERREVPGKGRLARPGRPDERDERALASSLDAQTGTLQSSLRLLARIDQQLGDFGTNPCHNRFVPRRELESSQNVRIP
jgi:hypothetical protein